MLIEDFRRDRYSYFKDPQVGAALRELDRQMSNNRGLIEETLAYEDLEDLRRELLQRQNRIFRALARELREIRNGENSHVK